MKRRDWGAFTHKNWHSFTWWQRKCVAFCQVAILPTHFLRMILPEQGRIGKLVPLLLEWMDFALSQRCKLVERLSVSIATWIGNNWENLNICLVQFSIQDGVFNDPRKKTAHEDHWKKKSENPWRTFHYFLDDWEICTCGGREIPRLKVKAKGSSTIG